MNLENSVFYLACMGVLLGITQCTVSENKFRHIERMAEIKKGCHVKSSDKVDDENK